MYGVEVLGWDGGDMEFDGAKDRGPLGLTLHRSYLVDFQGVITDLH